MKHFIIILSIFTTNFLFSQVESCKEIKIENQNLKSENLYFKKVLEINKSILEQEKDKTTYKITKIKGDKSNKTIIFNILLESKDQNKFLEFSDIYIIDLEGNKYEIDYFKSSVDIHLDLVLEVPLKMVLGFSNIIEEPKVIKLLKFRVKTKLEKYTSNGTFFELEFKDLNVNWE